MPNDETTTLTINRDQCQGHDSLTFHFDPPILTKTELGNQVMDIMRSIMRKTYPKEDK